MGERSTLGSRAHSALWLRAWLQSLNLHSSEIEARFERILIDARPRVTVVLDEPRSTG